MVEPQRTCVGCRARAAQRDLLRVVVADGALVPDARRLLPGRGAYVHPDPACLERATRRRAWARAFRLPGGLREASLRDADLRRAVPDAARAESEADRGGCP